MRKNRLQSLVVQLAYSARINITSVQHNLLKIITL